LNIFKTLLAEPPATKIAKESRKLPAATLLPGMEGWLRHVFSFFLHNGLLQLVTTVAIVPVCLTSTEGSGVLHE
jgi:hypothetical protein